MQRNRPQNTGVVSNSNGGAAANNVNNRVAGFPRQRDSRDDDYARSEQLIEACNNFFIEWRVSKVI